MENIYQAISGVMRDIGAIGKDSTNQQQGFKYRGIDDVMNALSPAMLTHKMFVVPECLDQVREERLSAANKTLLYSIIKVRYTFYAEDGTFVQATTIGEGMDSGDKATNKAMAIAFKYACFQAFCIPTKEMVDPDGESHEVATDKKTLPTKQAERDEDQGQLIQNFNTGISEKQVKRLYAIAGKAGISSMDVLKVVVKDYKKTSIESLTREQYEEICTRLEAKGNAV
jgi:hypothetical protein